MSGHAAAAPSSPAEMPIHLEATAPLAERVLLPGDPGRALRLAQELIDAPKMFNHNRGLWGYSGPAKRDGLGLTIQSTGMGGPSAAIVIHELISLGARRLVRVGTCGALDASLELGQLLVVSEALTDDGTSRALGGGPRVIGSPQLLTRLRETVDSAEAGPVVSTDLFYDAEPREAEWRGLGARAVEMETATLFALAAQRGVDAGAILLVTDLLNPGRHVRIDAAGLEIGELRLGHAALSALA
jgi:uridine phosphorylase